jgi:O-antigen biosynthesis protein WbqP
MTKRMLDLIVVFVSLCVLAFPILTIMLFIKASSKGPIFYWSKRFGRYNVFFMMPKFRTMKVGTPEVATDLLENPAQYLTPVGSFLRKTSLDELPQLICVLKGDMSVVGPRPALHTQVDLIEARSANGIDRLLPGITGWAQVNGRDEIGLDEKIKLDLEYLENQSRSLDIKIMARTILVVLSARSITH